MLRRQEDGTAAYWAGTNGFMFSKAQRYKPNEDRVAYLRQETVRPWVSYLVVRTLQIVAFTSPQQKENKMTLTSSRECI